MLRDKFYGDSEVKWTQMRPFYFCLSGLDLGSTTTNVNYKANRKKYQTNEYITNQGLNWMSFGARQYDPQIGRFLSVDPLAQFG